MVHAVPIRSRQSPRPAGRLPAPRRCAADRWGLAGSGAANGCPGEGIPAIPHSGTTEARHDGSDGIARQHGGHVPGELFGTGLADEKYVVEKFHARADGDIVRVPAGPTGAKGAAKAKRVVATLKAVRELRPGRTEQAKEWPLRRARAAGRRRRSQRRFAMWLRRKRRYAGVAGRHRRLECLWQLAGARL